MRILLFFLMAIISLVSCNSDEDACPEFWNLNKRELPAYAAIDSSQLILSAWNPGNTDVIELSQTGLIGDFELSLSLNGFQWDSLVSPQFRFEVFNAGNPSEDLCGVALNPLAAYCYVGSGPENRDMRLISDFDGILVINRSNGIITCASTLGNVSFQYSDDLHNDEMGVRLILGSTHSSSGKVEVRIESFEINLANEDTRVVRDDFDCESW